MLGSYCCISVSGTLGVFQEELKLRGVLAKLVRKPIALKRDGCNPELPCCSHAQQCDSKSKPVG